MLSSLLLLLSLICFSPTQELQVASATSLKDFYTKKVHVHVANGLSNNKTFVRVHCQSKDDDIGYHDLYIKQEIQWSFKMNWIDTTLFFCHFWWNNFDTSFDVFNASFGQANCGQDPNICYWLVKEDGFYFSGKEHPTPNDFSLVNNW
ncbi:hypothetical protein M9H77_03410 [Catharanthus roseus]|uniref:Uncharacterized protein n=1 Tax=Catharanthus roseus TaxID=4058 RepID=A0ACC0CBF9_CATRO|nr:hypothetical protein M9H77_03410 [Catharanthus roseus]